MHSVQYIIEVINMPEVKRRHPAAVIILTLITFGIYSIYWFVKTKDEINSFGSQIPTGWLLIIPIANFYFLYKYFEGFSNAVKKDNNGLLWFLVYIIFSPVAVIIVQMELNKFAEKV